jgi:antitoxin ParD1/3/4
MGMNVSLTPALEAFVRERTASGDYNNASEVVREALRVLKQVQEERALRRERLQAALAEGDAALAQGDAVELSDDAALADLFERL